MKELMLLQFSEDKNINITTTNKEDTYFMFDEIMIEYKKGMEKVTLYHDFLCEGIKTFKNLLCRAVFGELQILESLEQQTRDTLMNVSSSISIGYSFNVECNNLYNDQPDNLSLISKYSLWSGIGEQSYETWLYNKEEKIYIEISPTFCWDDSKRTESDIKCFNHFLRNYKIYDVLEISKENADLWIQKCENILKGLGK